jgi:DNA-binding XRE family transcriptional regulator
MVKSEGILKEESQLEKLEQIERGRRIKGIRENELKMKKTQLGKAIGVSGQFLGLVEEGKGNLAYKSIKRLKEISGFSSDYILYGLDDNIIKETRKILGKYTDKQIMEAIEIIKEIALFIKSEDKIKKEDNKK